jgi:acyl carrier protein
MFSSTLNELLELIHKTFDIDPATIDPDKPLEDYGLDSLSKAELLFAIEDRFGFEYPEKYTAVATLGALAEVVTMLRAPAVA